MATKYSLERFPWISEGANSYVYEINPLVVVKIPKSEEEERQQFRKEVNIFEILSQRPRCPFLISCFYHCNIGIFLEYMRDICLSWRIQQNHIRDHDTMRVTQVKKLEPLQLRTTWMNDLAQGVAFLESLNFAHGDLRPENVLLDRDRLKLADFDCAAEVGSVFEACIPPYGRLLGPEAGPAKGTAGYLGPRTEQFSLGSLFYLINYGFEVYDDECFGDDPSGKEHGPVVLDLLQRMIFPKLNGDAAIDNIIEKSWFGRYGRVADLAMETAELGIFNLDAVGAEFDRSNVPREALANGASLPDICQDLVKDGLLEALSSYNPRESGRSIERRHICWKFLEQ